MHKASFRAVVLTSVVGVVFLVAPASTQGPGGGRAVQMVNGREAAPGEALVRFRNARQPANPAALRAQADAQLLESIGGTGVVRVRSRSLDAASLVAVLSRRGDVLYAEPNYIVRTFAQANDASFPQLWGLENLGQAVNGGVPGIAGADIRATSAWDISVGSTSHVVAVMDTGIDYTHPDLVRNMWSAPAPFTIDFGGGSIVQCAAGTHGFNAVTRTCNPMDDQGHGTHVAGTIGASGNDGVGVVGVNWTTQLMAIKSLDAGGSGTIAGAIDAIRFAIEARRAFPGAADVRILSASWGGPGFSQALLDEINAAHAADILVVAAAGNSGAPNDLFPIYPASYNAANVVAVAATTNTDERAWFSNYGATTVHLGAPGVDIFSTTPGDTYAFKSGTSMATPHVSGAAALVLSRCTLDTTGLKDALIGSVRPVPGMAAYTITGGQLDVFSAIHTCLGPPTTPTGLTAAGGQGQVLLSWSAPLGVTGYVVKRSPTPGGPYTPIASGVKGAKYTDNDVVNGTTYYYVVSATNPMGGSGDSNEASATPNLRSDLVVSGLAAPATAAAGSTISVSMTTTNQGAGPAAASRTRIYLSTNGAVDAGDQSLEPVHDVPALGPGSLSTLSLSVDIPVDTPTGARYLIAVADVDRAITETQESNNTRLRSLNIGPDLVVAAFTAPAAAAAGAAVTVSDTVKNQGGAAAASSTTSFYLSANAVLDASDTLLSGGRAVPMLVVEASNSGNATVTIPATTPAGSYYLIAEADGGRAVAEFAETNNARARSIRIGADLVVSAFSAPAAAGAGAAIQVSDTTTNQGTGSVGITNTRFYLSTNSQVDSADAMLGGRAVPALDPGAGSAATTPVTIPAATITGAYYILAVADADHVVAETLESNNQTARLIQIGGDVKTSALTAPAAAGPGASITIGDTTSNQGGGAIGPTTTRYYFSSNSLLDGQDTVLGGRPVPGLDAGASHTGGATVTLPATIAPGTYYIIAKADADDVAAETQEGNNTSARTMQVGGDLVVSAFSAPSKGGAGLTLLVSDTTLNQGTATVAASVVRFYLSPNAGLDAGDFVFAEGRSVPELAPGAESGGSTLLTVPVTTGPGTYYLFAKADGDATVLETQESNNAALRSVLIGTDLVVSTLAVPAKGEAGSTISVSETTSNQGGGAAPASTTGFSLSEDLRLDSGDVTLFSGRGVGALAPGASSSAATSVTIPAGTRPGAYYVIASADLDGSVAETSESNNTRYQPLLIGPDLTVSSASLPASTISAGSTSTVTDIVVNQGAGVAGASATRFYLSANPTFDAFDVLLSGGRAVGPIAGGATSSGTSVITIPAGTAAGTYYLFARADGDGDVLESVETNNVRTVRSIQVTAP